MPFGLTMSLGRVSALRGRLFIYRELFFLNAGLCRKPAYLQAMRKCTPPHARLRSEDCPNHEALLASWGQGAERGLLSDVIIAAQYHPGQGQTPTPAEIQDVQRAWAAAGL